MLNHITNFIITSIKIKNPIIRIEFMMLDGHLEHFDFPVHIKYISEVSL